MTRVFDINGLAFQPSETRRRARLYFEEKNNPVNHKLPQIGVPALNL